MGTFYGTELHFGLFFAVWLGGIATGACLGGATSFGTDLEAGRPMRRSLHLLIAAPYLSLVAARFGCAIIPASSGAFLPLVPFVGFMALVLLPVTVPIGYFIPAALKDPRGSVGLGGLYGWESVGSFLAGVLFSIALGGLPSSLMTMAIIPVLPLAALVIASPRKRSPRILLLLLAPATAVFFPAFGQALEKGIWERFHPVYLLRTTRESPYQLIQIAEYRDQRSLFLNGVFSAAWPDPSRAEERVHPFMTAIASPARVLLLGMPAPDMVEELHKYPGLQLHAVEIDRVLAGLLASDQRERQGLEVFIDDPRSFLTRPGVSYDGIIVLPTDPTTLVSNRLFTEEAFRAISGRLSPNGVACIGVAGTENYLGPEMEGTLLPIHRGLKKAFRFVAPVPGDPIQFWCGNGPDPIATSPESLGERFRLRGLQTVSFRDMSFRNLLLPFRVSELESWLNRPATVAQNLDHHPRAFSRQLQLWDIYSGSRFGGVLSRLQEFDIEKTALGVASFALLSAIALWYLGTKRRLTAVLSGTAGVSGGTGILAEIVLILVFQNRHGALFQMAAAFFGLYMLGLAGGAVAASRTENPGWNHLRGLKIAQVALTGLLTVLFSGGSLDNTISIGAGIFLVAFLAGWEFPILDLLLRRHLDSPTRSAGLLLFTDNLGALVGGLFTGPWLLPVLGMEGTFGLLLLLLGANLAILAIFGREPDGK